MKIDEWGIPHFEVGEHVRVTIRPVETKCPKCGRNGTVEGAGGTAIGIVLASPTPDMACPKCHHYFQSQYCERWVAVQFPNNTVGAFPDTFLQPLDFI